ncbi:MAG: hypothetical protein AB1724_17485 [Thermodesulfobacteriota bacterium]
MKKLLRIACAVMVFSLILFPTFPPAVRAGEETRKTLSRQLDPVVVSGDATGPFWGRRIDHMRLYARRDGAWAAVPFQIDKVNPDGDYFINGNTIPPEVREAAGFEDLPEEEKRENRIRMFERNRGDYEKRVQTGEITRAQLAELEHIVYTAENMDYLDWNDEVVFMARDSGDRAPTNAWLTPDGLEIQATDPLNGRTGWVYCFHFDNDPPPPSESDYVCYDPAADRVISRFMETGFLPGKPMIVNSIIGKPPGRPVMPNILDRFKLRIKVNPIILLCAPLHFDENNTRGVTFGYKDGPVRVLRRNVFWIMIAGIKLPFAPRIGMWFKFYENGLAASSNLDLPFDPGFFICDGSTFTAGLDFRETIHGARILTRDNTVMIIDGTMNDQEENLARSDQDWVAGYLPSGAALMSRMIYDPEMIARGTKMDLYYLDDASVNDPPEEENGQHMIGYAIGIKSLPRRYHLGFEIFVAYDFEPSQVQELLDIDDSPLVVTSTTADPD